jgi:hypothetical protein
LYIFRNDSYGANKSNKDMYNSRYAKGVNTNTLNEYEEQPEQQTAEQQSDQQAHHQGNEKDTLGKDSKTLGKDDSKEGQRIAIDRDKGGAGKDGKTSNKKPKKTVKKTVKKTDDFDEKLKSLKAVEPPPLKMPNPGDMSFERDSISAKDRKNKIIEELRGQLRKAKNERVDLEKQRDHKVRRAKSLQTQTLQKRNQGNDGFYCLSWFCCASRHLP